MTRRPEARAGAHEEFDRQPVGLLPRVDLPVGWTRAPLALGFHAVVAVAAVVVLWLPWGALGWRVAAIVVAYHVGMLVVSRWPAGEGWLRAWAVLAPLSILMVLPDWFVSAVLETLRVPDTGAAFVGTVPVFMAGMWVMALFPLVLVAAATEKRFGARPAVVVVALAGAMLFWAAELLAPVIPLWEPIGVDEVGGIAAYVLPAEVMLSVVAWLVVRGSLWRSRTVTAVSVIATPVLYTGALALGYQVLP